MFRTFQQGLRDLGWVEGQNVAIEWRFSEGSAEPLPRLAAELVGVPVELIVATPTRPALAAKEATSTIPIVFIQVADPIQSGIVTNLARPGANITGLSTIGSDLSGKRLELLKEALPGAERVAVLWNRPSEGSVLVFRELQFSSRELGIELQDIGISDPGELRDAVEFAIRRHVGAIMVIDDPVIASYRPQIVQLSSKAALPLFSIYTPTTRTTAASWPMGPAFRRSIGVAPPMSTASCGVPSRATSRSSNPASSSWSSIYGRQRHSGSN
jgi:putative ABC transport system substrate-binding protein